MSEKIYICPQCGPDPLGEEEHARLFHTFPERESQHETVIDPFLSLAQGLSKQAFSQQSTRLERIVCAIVQGKNFFSGDNAQRAVWTQHIVGFADSLRRAIDIRESDPDFNKHG